MKKLILALVLTVFSLLTAFSQSYSTNYQQGLQKYVPAPNTVATTNITLNQVQSGWALQNQACAGCPSYWYQVLMTQTPIQAEDGLYYYYYYFNFFSNSHYTNGVKASTYLSQLNFYYNGIFALNAPYLLLPAGQQVWGAWIRLGVNNAVVQFTVSNVSVQ